MKPQAKRLKEETGAAQPLWLNIADVLRKRIKHGVDSASLSDVSLSSEFKVSTAIVRRAVHQLVREGLLVRRRGKGTFPAGEPVRGGLEALEAFVDEWRLQGHSVRIELVDRRLVAANMTVAAGLGVRPGEIVCYLRRLRLADDLPVAMDYRHIPAELVDGIADDDFRNESIWQVLKRHKNIVPETSRVTIKAAAANPEVARSLDVPVGAPVLDYEVQVLDRLGRVIILGSSLYHSERFVYSTTVKGART